MNFINTVVSKALEELSEELATACITKNYFVTRVEEEGSIPIKVNGIYQVPKPKSYAIIDATREATLNEEDFKEHSQKLYIMFFSIDDWKNC